MKKYLLFILSLALQFGLVSAEPLRVFIRAGEKTHGVGAHDYPAFLKDWTKLLNERGAKATGAMTFPSEEQLAKTDVLILHSEEAGNIEGDDRAHLEAYLKRGGGVVAIHGGAVSRDSDWYQSVIGGSWKFGQTKWLEGHMSLYFTDHENPITKDCSNFDLDDEIYYDFVMNPKSKILAAAYTPNPKSGEAGQGAEVNIYDIQPQIWTYEKDNYRAFVNIPGHLYENFSHNSVRTILLRGIAWAGKRENVNEFCKPEELASALRYPEGGPTRPEEAGEKIELHPEFELSLVASEPLINKVMNLDWDEKGRLWVVETPEYPNGLRKANTDVWKESGSVEPGDYDRDPEDRISILSDSDGDGVMDKKQVFADKLELATSFVFYKNGVIVSAAPNIWYLEDSDGDLVADKRTKLYTGLGTADTHAVINNLRWGLDGWIYATHGYSGGQVTAEGKKGAKPVGIGSGVIRFKPDGTEIEMYSSKGGNTWGLCMTSDGQCFWTQPTSGTVFFHTVLPEYVLAEGKIPGTNSWNGMITGQKTYPLMHWEQMAYRQIDQVGAYTAAAGCAIYEGGAWPEKWHYSYFTGEPTINIVSHYFVTPKGVTYQTHKEKDREKTEFIRSRDLWFRPIENRVGPDGALYVVDFYNQAVIHNDTRGPQHGPAGAAVRPDRDHYFGRIWRIQHKDAKKITTPALDKNNVASLKKALEHPNGHTRMLAARLLREAGQPVEAPVGTKPLQAYESSQKASTPAEFEGILEKFAAANDNWTRSAYVAVASERPLDYVKALLVSPQAPKLGELASILATAALNADGEKSAIELVHAVASAPAEVAELKVAFLDSIAQKNNLKVAMTPQLAKDLDTLLQAPDTAQHVLPLVAAWDEKGDLKGSIGKIVHDLSEKLGDNSASVSDRAQAASLLAKVNSDVARKPLVAILLNKEALVELQSVVIKELGESGQGKLLAQLFPKLDAKLQGAAFDEVVKRPESTLNLLEQVAKGEVSAADIGPGNVSRLRSHPDKAVASRAEELIDQLMPGMKELAATIAKLTPEVVKPGDAVAGKLVFGAACAICHRYDDLGTHDVGPPLTGMGSHGAAELLVHLVDPNREVDPSFWQWNITLKNGEALAGVIASENSASLTLRNQGGDTEIRKDDIAQRVNTRRSLMPEGLDALGAKNLRDILTYLTAEDGRYRILDMREAYTADARKGLFSHEKSTDDSIFPMKYGNIVSEEIPFFLMDPATSLDGDSLLVLKGGPRRSTASTYPQKVEIPVGLEATRFYLMSGIAGWGYPAISDDRPALKVTVNFADGSTEVTEFLNKVAFGDYNHETENSGSLLLQDVVSRGQARLITVPVKKTGTVKSLILESYGNGIAPVVMSITADLSSEGAPVKTVSENSQKSAAAKFQDEPAESTIATGQKFAEPKAENGTRVLLLGAGSSHHFPRDFIGADRETLRKVKGVDAIGTMNLAESLQLLPQADVLIFSGNHEQWGTDEFQKALNDFADAGKGIILIHAATWSHPWKGYNARFVGGDTKGHGYGDVTALNKKKGHPVMKGVPDTFHIEDESYHFNFFKDAKVELLAENKPDGQTPTSHPALWVVMDPKTRIVCYTHGHAVEAHANKNYQQILRNAVKWVAEKKK